jgi:hypothetical protein
MATQQDEDKYDKDSPDAFTESLPFPHRWGKKYKVISRLTVDDASTAYQEIRAHHGRMHNTMYAMPPSFAIVIGALWFFAAQSLEKNPFVSLIVFVFTAVVTRFLFDAYTVFATRTEEMRLWIIERFEGQFAFTNDDKKKEEKREADLTATYDEEEVDNKNEKNWLYICGRLIFLIKGKKTRENQKSDGKKDQSFISGWWDFLVHSKTIREMQDSHDEPGKGGIQRKTREEFRKVMRAAGWLSLSGAAYASVLAFGWFPVNVETTCEVRRELQGGKVKRIERCEKSRMVTLPWM